MNEQKVLEDMLAGHVDITTFSSLVKCDARMCEYINGLLPYDAVGNDQHLFWKRVSYESFKICRFSFVNFLNRLCRFDGTISDNLNVFSFIKNVYTYSHPEVVCTSKYHESFDLYLDVVKDCYDGPEVKTIVQKIIVDALPLKTKKARRSFCKEMIIEQFHVSGRARPRWIQGPEWPMGMYSPMTFIAQTTEKGCVHYRFVDVDTGDIRIVIQHY